MSISSISAAQEGHYWTIQFGSRSTLLGGAVVGSTVDASANFYNPGAVGLMEDATLVQSTAVYLWETLTVENKFPEVEKKNYDSISNVPNFTGGIINLGILGASRIGYSLFSRHSFKLNLGLSRQDSLSVIERFEGKEDYSGFASRTLDVRDRWYGFTMGYRLKPNLGIGVSPFLSVRQLNEFNQAISVQAFSTDTENANSSLFRDYSFTVYSLIFKLGLYYELSGVSLGLAVTTPGIKLAGSGSIFESANAFNQDATGDGTINTIFDSQVLSGVSASYPTPLSLAFGASYQSNTMTWYLTSEWYSAISPFNPYDVTTLSVIVDDQVFFTDLTIETKSVVNVAVGVEKRLSETTQIFLSALTDRSALVQNERLILSVADWDLLHVTTGASFRIFRFALTAGVGYVYGSGDSSIPIGFVNPSERNFLLGERANEKVRYRGFKFIFGIEFGAKESADH